MITESRKDRASKINGFEKERYEDKVRKAVRDEMFPEDEIAILRKAVVAMYDKFNKLIDIVATLHPEEVAKLELLELEEYNTIVERIKEEQR